MAEIMIIEEYSKLKDRLNLKPRYLQIFEFKYGIDDQPHTLKQSGQKFNISPERVRQIIARVLYELEKITNA